MTRPKLLSTIAGSADEPSVRRKQIGRNEFRRARQSRLDTGSISTQAVGLDVEELEDDKL